MAGWCFLFSYVLIKWQFICWNRSYCILSMLQGWTEISSLKYSELFSESRNKEEMLSIGLYLYIQVFTVSIKSDFIFLQFSIFSDILFCVCVCVFGFEALCFQKALIPDSDRLSVFHAVHHNNYWMYINCCLPCPNWIVWINDYHVLVYF